MKFLVDAQLPPRLAVALRAQGHDAVHTRDLPNGNETPDAAVAQAADEAGRVVVSKDVDFRNSHLVAGSPARLLVIRIGNASADVLLGAILFHLPEIEDAFERSSLIELTAEVLVVHSHDRRM